MWLPKSIELAYIFWMITPSYLHVEKSASILMWKVVAETYFHDIPEFVSVGEIPHVADALEGCGTEG